MGGFEFPSEGELGDIKGICGRNGAEFGELDLEPGKQRLRELISAVVPPRTNK